MKLPDGDNARPAGAHAPRTPIPRAGQAAPASRTGFLTRRLRDDRRIPAREAWHGSQCGRSPCPRIAAVRNTPAPAAHSAALITFPANAGNQLSAAQRHGFLRAQRGVVPAAE